MSRKIQLSDLKVSSFVTKAEHSRIVGGRGTGPTTDGNDSSCIQDYCTFDCEGSIE